MYAKPHSYIFVMHSSMKNVGLGEDLFVNLTWLLYIVPAIVVLYTVFIEANLTLVELLCARMCVCLFFFCQITYCIFSNEHIKTFHPVV